MGHERSGRSDGVSGHQQVLGEDLMSGSGVQDDTAKMIDEEVSSGSTSKRPGACEILAGTVRHSTSSPRPCSNAADHRRQRGRGIVHQSLGDGP
jgi:hypothetical protein